MHMLLFVFAKIHLLKLFCKLWRNFFYVTHLLLTLHE
nr:MAG TPA: hypothetical protein [Caudoviricetes sp.]